MPLVNVPLETVKLPPEINTLPLETVNPLATVAACKDVVPLETVTPFETVNPFATVKLPLEIDTLPLETVNPFETATPFDAVTRPCKALVPDTVKFPVILSLPVKFKGPFNVVVPVTVIPVSNMVGPPAVF